MTHPSQPSVGFFNYFFSFFLLEEIKIHILFNEFYNNFYSINKLVYLLSKKNGI